MNKRGRKPIERERIDLHKVTKERLKKQTGRTYEDKVRLLIDYKEKADTSG